MEGTNREGSFQPEGVPTLMLHARQNVLTKFVLYETKPVASPPPGGGSVSGGAGAGRDPHCLFLKKRYYLVGSNRQKTAFKVLKIDRTLPHELAFLEDPEVPPPSSSSRPRAQKKRGGALKGLCVCVCVVWGEGCYRQTYSRVEIQQLLAMVENGNKASGGMKKTCVAFGILGDDPRLLCSLERALSS